MTSPTWSDMVGICGSVIFLGAFAYANITEALNKILFNMLNLIGAVLLLISLSVHFNLAATVLEVCWGIIAFFGLMNALRTRRARQP
jgi:energy-converting hydrogenase Eha subunit C